MVFVRSGICGTGLSGGGDLRVGDWGILKFSGLDGGFLSGCVTVCVSGEGMFALGLRLATGCSRYR